MIILGTLLDGIRTLKDRTLKITFETNELNPQELLGLMECVNQYGYLCFKKEPFTESEKKIIEEMKSDYNERGKSSAQRLRSVLYLMWKQNPEGFDSSIKHYEHHMEIILNQYKNNLD